MSNRLVQVAGLLTPLLALMMQLGIAARMPRFDLLAQIAGPETLCHAADGAAGPPTRAPMHPLDCLVCPLCTAQHASSAIQVSDSPTLTRSTAAIVLSPELPPPPGPRRPPSQSRAPPITS